MHHEDNRHKQMSIIFDSVFSNVFKNLRMISRNFVTDWVFFWFSTNVILVQCLTSVFVSHVFYVRVTLPTVTVTLLVVCALIESFGFC